MYFSGFIGNVYASEDGWFEIEHHRYEFEGATSTKEHFEHIKRTFRDLSVCLEWWEATLPLEPTEKGDTSKYTLYAYKGVLDLINPLTMAQVRSRIKSDLVLKPAAYVGEDSVEIDWSRNPEIEEEERQKKI